MAVAKKTVAKKVVAKKAAAKKAPAKKTAAKKAPAVGRATMALATEQLEFSVDDVVLMDGDTSAAGRVCRELNFGRYCVHFPDIGCKRVPASSLRLAPAGTSAPDCAGCTDC